MLYFLILRANDKTPKFCFFFFVIRVYKETLGRMLKPLLPKFRPDLSICLKDFVEKQVSAKLKPIVGIIELERGDQIFLG